MAHITWTETAPGQFERDQDVYEKFMTAWGKSAAQWGREQVLVHAYIDYHTDRKDIVDAFKKAWIALRYWHPSIAAYLENGKSTYSTSDLDPWLEETFVVSNGTADDAFSATRLVSRPILRVFPDSQQIMVQASHNRLDAIGSAMLLNALFELVEKPQQVTFGNETERLSYPFEIIAKLSPESSPEDMEAAQQQLQQMMPPGIGVPTKNLDQDPSDSKSEELVFSESETAAIIQACRAAGCTVTHATHAAVHLTTQALAGQEGDFAGQLVSSMRPRFGESGNDFAISLTYAKFGRVGPGSFLDTVEGFKEHYRSAKAENIDLVKGRATAIILTSVLAQPPPVPMTQPELSAIGVLDKYIRRSYGDIDIIRYHQKTSCVSPRILCTTWTLHGRFTISTVYNQAYYEPEFIHRLLLTFKEELFKGLKL